MTDDNRPLVRGELRAASQAAGAAMAKAADRGTRLHLEDIRDQVARALDPKFQPAVATPSAPGSGRPGLEILDRLLNGDSVGCWPDYSIRRN